MELLASFFNYLFFIFLVYLLKRTCGYFYLLLNPLGKRAKYMQLIQYYTNTQQKKKLNKANMELFKSGSISCLITFPLMSAFMDLFNWMFKIDYLIYMIIAVWITLDVIEKRINNMILYNKIKSIGVGF